MTEQFHPQKIGQTRKKRVRRKHIFDFLISWFAESEFERSLRKHKQSEFEPAGLPSQKIARTTKKKKRSSLLSSGDFQKPSATISSLIQPPPQIVRIVKTKKRSSLSNYSHYQEPLANPENAQPVRPVLRSFKKKKRHKVSSLPLISYGTHESNSSIKIQNGSGKSMAISHILKSPFTWAAAVGGFATLIMFVPLTLGGVPIAVIQRFLFDQQALNAYFNGDSRELHNRLSAMGVEEEVKSYYRSQITNETELDQHIHQIMFERTGYVGEAYVIDKEGNLKPK